MNKKTIISFFKAFLTKFKEEGIYKESAALTFVTLLGFIPFFIFLIFFIPELPFLKAGSQFSDLLISIFLPESAAQISEYVSQLATQRITFNLFSFVILMGTSYSLFKIINDSFDNILNVHAKRKRGAIFNFIKFLGMVIFGSLLILLLLSTTSLPLVSRFFEVSYFQKMLLHLTPFLILFIIFSLGFAFIPTIRIRTKSIFIGSAIASIVWIIFKSFFNWYIFTLTNTQLIFGYFASVPIFLFWIYANWIIILCGVIIVSILEGRHKIKEIPESDLQTVRITFEKQIDENKFSGLNKAILDRDEVKSILKELLAEEVEVETVEKTETPINEFTEKDE